MIFRSIVFSAVVAGFIVGALITVVQQFGTVPLILKGETYEKTAEKPAASAHKPAVTVGHADHDHASHDHTEAWEPRDGWERNSYTAAANILTAIGFALLLSGIFALRGHAVSGHIVTWHEGLLWGLGGFAVFTVAPGLGLPPELPGMPVAPLLARQIWWVGTAAATAAGLGLLFFRRAPWAAVLGIALLILPHAIGAPQIENAHSIVPETLSHRFVVAATITSLLFWSLLGSVTSMAHRYFSTPAAAAVRAA